MILGRNHLILLFDTESQSSSKQIWIMLLGTKYLSFHKFFNFLFKRHKHFVNHFWLRWYVIQQPFTKIFNLLHTLNKEIFYICLTFIMALDGFKVLVVKPEWDHSEWDHQRCYFFVLLISTLPIHVSTLLSELIITSYTSLFCDRFQLYYCVIVHFYS